MDGNDLDDERLLELLLAALDQNFALLVTKFQERLLRFACRLMRNQHDAEDIVQESFLSAYKALKNRPDQHRKTRLAAWLYTITLHKCRDHLGPRASQPPDPPISLYTPGLLEALDYKLYNNPQEQPEAVVEAIEIYEWTINKINELPDLARKVAFLYIIEDLDRGEIADLFRGISPNTIKTHVTRSQCRLRKEWKRHLEEGED
jgi:RNA polymerase sigma-70 factor (ECF subfamily)